jgi:hypothetical protein
MGESSCQLTDSYGEQRLACWHAYDGLDGAALAATAVTRARLDAECRIVAISILRLEVGSPEICAEGGDA